MPSKNIERANQFLPYNALKGFRAIIKEKEKIKVEKKDLSPDTCDELNCKILQVKPGMIIKIVYYSHDEYIALEGMVAKIDLEYSKSIQIVKEVIPINSIIEISGDKIVY